MKNSDRDALAITLRAIADRLAEAESIGRDKAIQYAALLPEIYRPAFIDAFLLGWIRDACARAAHEITSATAHYLLPGKSWRR